MIVFLMFVDTKYGNNFLEIPVLEKVLLTKRGRKKRKGTTNNTFCDLLKTIYKLRREINNKLYNIVFTYLIIFGLFYSINKLN